MLQKIIIDEVAVRDDVTVYSRHRQRDGSFSRWTRFGRYPDRDAAYAAIAIDEARDRSMGGLIDPGQAPQYQIRHCIETTIETHEGGWSKAKRVQPTRRRAR